MRKIAISFVLACLSASVSAQTKPANPKAESKEVKVDRAVSAGPAHIAKAARVVDVDQKGNEIVLREGTNGFACYPGHPG